MKYFLVAVAVSSLVGISVAFDTTHQAEYAQSQMLAHRIEAENEQQVIYPEIFHFEEFSPQGTDLPVTPAAPQETDAPSPKTTETPTPPITTKKVVITPKVTSTPKPTSISTPTPIPTMDFSKPWQVASNCPISTQNCVPCTSGVYCRYEPKYKNQHGFLGWACQNNNPGNIRDSSYRNTIIVQNGGPAACGVRYDSRGGSYFVFSTYTNGMNALKAYIKGINNGQHSSYTGCGNCSLALFFSKYAPGDSGYAGFVAGEIGETTETTLNYVVTNKLDQFVAAIKKKEGFFVQ